MNSIDTSSKYTPVVSSHFFPKFKNQNKISKIVPEKNNEYILCVSKKHSGSLVMAPPFYSKNATANEYSRIACVVLYEYFQAVWPGNGKEKFKEWWDHSERNKLCYSFEVVVPRTLGDHAEIPKTGYCVLLAVTKADQNLYLSPIDILKLATQWRLPINDAWYIDSENASIVEDQLYEHRWRMRDSQADEFLQKYTKDGDECNYQYFLKHGELQGEILEGFVISLLETNLKDIGKYIKKYHDVMSMYHDAALECFENFGKLLNADEKGVIEKVMKLEYPPLNDKEIYQEPLKILCDVENAQEQIWNFVCNQGEEGSPIRTFFNHLRNYIQWIRLSLYVYKDSYQVQIKSVKDEVFYQWNIHTTNSNSIQFFRGMVVSFYKDGTDVSFYKDGTDISLNKDKDGTVQNQDKFQIEHPIKIHKIAKVKCLEYLCFTFGIRNQLPSLQKNGKEHYLQGIKSHFYKNWSVPTKYQDKLDNFFLQWAEYFESLNNNQKSKITTRYLKVVQLKFLKKHKYPYGPDVQDLLVANPKEKNTLVVIAILGLPPGGGKTSMYSTMKDKENCFVVSSDESKCKKNFENSIREIGNQRINSKITYIGYDKNIPDLIGLYTLLKVLDGLSYYFHVRTVFVTPDKLEENTFWERIKSRDIRTATGLCIGGKMSKARVENVFRDVYYAKCIRFLPLFHKIPKIIISSDFLVPEEDGMKLHSKKIDSIIADPNKYSCKINGITKWMVDELEVSNYNVYSSDIVRNNALSGVFPYWVAAEISIPRFNGLHLTLVPPPNKDISPEVHEERQEIIRKFEKFQGKEYKITIRGSKYHTLYIDPKLPHVKGRTKKIKKIGFWEVDEIIGLDDEYRYSQQKDYYHITDIMSASSNTPNKYAYFGMVQLKNKENKYEEFRIETKDYPFEVEGIITLYI